MNPAGKSVSNPSALVSGRRNMGRSDEEYEHNEMLRRAIDVASPEDEIDREKGPRPRYPRYRVEPSKRFDISKLDPDESEGYKNKGDVEKDLERQIERIADLQERLYAEGKQSLLIVLQATDTGGKDGTIKGVFRGVNPQGCQVWSFKVPTPDELARDFLWRYHRKVPGKGMIAIFNRSHYEDVLVVRVKELVPKEVWQARYAQINDFERMLAMNGTIVLKFYLHISKEEQKERLQSRLDEPDKRWKFHIADLAERDRWDEYMSAFEDALNNCSTPYAPWYAIPANKKWYRNLVIARTIADTLEAMDPHFPPPEEDLDNITIPD
jgi:PPK2 family polyphosphate:nucleotide phosphotransferase